MLSGCEADTVVGMSELGLQLKMSEDKAKNKVNATI
jgi:hypothetical protein